MTHYDHAPDPTGHQWTEDDNRADDRIHAEKQAETDAKLNSDELSLLLSLLATFTIDLHRLRRNPVMSEESRKTYSASIALAESTKRKLLGV